MDYINFLKEHENFDKYILFLLALRENPTEIARKLNISRSTVYDAIERNKGLMENYYLSLKEVMEGAENESATNMGPEVEGQDSTGTRPKDK